MNAVIGQEKLVKILDNYTLQTVPKTMLFLGPHGCGKSWIAARFANQLNVDFVVINKETPVDKLIEYYQWQINKFYFIELAGIDEKQQNKFLKLIEEPSSNMNIILMAESEIGILPTILNRCVKYHFEPYTIEQLKMFEWITDIDEEIVYQICKTPGQLNEFADDSIKGAFPLCTAILTQIKTANYANTLSLVTKINCKEDYKKINFDAFLDILTYSAFKRYKEENDEFSLNVYFYLIKQQAKTLNKSINKESFLLDLFDQLWRLSH